MWQCDSAGAVMINKKDPPDDLKDLPDDLKISMIQENDKGEVTFVVLEATGKPMLAAEYDAAVNRWQSGLPREVRTHAGRDQTPHIRALDVALRAVEDQVPDAEVQSRINNAILLEIAKEFSLDEKSVKDMLRRRRGEKQR